MAAAQAVYQKRGNIFFLSSKEKAGSQLKSEAVAGFLTSYPPAHSAPCMNHMHACMLRARVLPVRLPWQTIPMLLSMRLMSRPTGSCGREASRARGQGQGPAIPQLLNPFIT